MKRKERCELLIHCRARFLSKWAKQMCEEAEMNLLEEPSTGLTMINMRESAKQSLFYLGEVLISEAKVECRGHIGIGMIVGNELQKAYDLAVIDAGYQAELAIILRFEQELMKEKKWIDEQRAIQNQNILKTRVSFETMDV